MVPDADVCLCVLTAVCSNKHNRFSMLPMKLCLTDGLKFRGEAEIFGGLGPLPCAPFKIARALKEVK